MKPGSPEADRAYERARDKETDKYWAPEYSCPWCGCRQDKDEGDCTECGAPMDQDEYFECPYCYKRWDSDANQCCGEVHIQRFFLGENEYERT